MKDRRLITVMEVLGEKISSLEMSLLAEQTLKKEMEKNLTALLAEKEKRINELEGKLQAALERIHSLAEGR